MPHPRFTKIVATLGPSCRTSADIEALAKLGVNVLRLNFSHGKHADHGEVIRAIRAVQKKGYPLAVMLDTKGPEVRTGDVTTAIEIKKGDTVRFTHHPAKKSKEKVVIVDYEHFAKDARHARAILVDNGVIEFRLKKILGSDVLAEALDDGRIGSRRHVNLPGAKVSLPSFTKRDWDDVAYGLKEGVDFIATSFVRSDGDIRKLRTFLEKSKSSAHIIAKIETPQAVDDLDDIIAASDGIMIARGDLGAEVPYEDVPGIEEMIVRRCHEEGKPVIVATHMLESMILSPIPTRAEVTDIAFAAFLLADSTMLSGETASGRHPRKAVEVMDRVLRKNELLALSSHTLVPDAPSVPQGHPDQPRREQAHAAAVLAHQISADAILVISKSGQTARAVSASRPTVPLHVITESPAVSRQMLLLWGVTPYIHPLSQDPEKTVADAIAMLVKRGVLQRGRRVVVVSDIRTTEKRAMTIQIRTVSSRPGRKSRPAQRRPKRRSSR